MGGTRGNSQRRSRTRERPRARPKGSARAKGGGRTRRSVRSRREAKWAWPLSRVVLLALITGVLVWVTRGRSTWLIVLLPALTVTALWHERAGLHRDRRELLAAALTDPLTGLENRRSLLARAEYEMVRHLRDRRSFAVVMVDLDGFKALNDRFGHDAGDELLCDVADALIRRLRAQDTVARLGGDEFCVLAPDTDPSGTPPLAARITQAVARASLGVEALRASVGIALFPQDGDSVERLMRVADQRLFTAKRARRDRARERRAA